MTSACRAPSASRQVTPAGPTSVPPPCPAMVAAPTGPVNGPSESPITRAAIASAAFVAAPPYIPPTSRTTSPRSSVANCERGAGNSVAPEAHEPIKKPEMRLTGAVSLEASRVVAASRPPPGGVDAPDHVQGAPREVGVVARGDGSGGEGARHGEGPAPNRVRVVWLPHPVGDRTTGQRARDVDAGVGDETRADQLGATRRVQRGGDDVAGGDLRCRGAYADGRAREGGARLPAQRIRHKRDAGNHVYRGGEVEPGRRGQGERSRNRTVRDGDTDREVAPAACPDHGGRDGAAARTGEGDPPRLLRGAEPEALDHRRPTALQDGLDRAIDVVDAGRGVRGRPDRAAARPEQHGQSRRELKGDRSPPERSARPSRGCRRAASTRSRRG